VIISEDELTTLRTVADHMVPAAHGMPSAGDVVDAARVAFVLGARPDLVEPLRAALREDLGGDPEHRLATLAEGDPVGHAALQLVVVGAYYTDGTVRQLIGYPGQVARPVNAHEYPEYLSEGLLDAALARGPVWRDAGTDVGGVD
jgi:hypothetical protein